MYNKKSSVKNIDFSTTALQFIVGSFKDIKIKSGIFNTEVEAKVKKLEQNPLSYLESKKACSNCNCAKIVGQ